MKISDLGTAREYLRRLQEDALVWTWKTPEEIKDECMLDIGVPALARKLRDARKAGVLISKLRPGKNYVEYAWATEEAREQALEQEYWERSEYGKANK